MPMSPEFLPEFFLLIAGLFLGGYAIYLLNARRWVRALGLILLAAACIAVAFVGGKSGHGQWKSSVPSLRPSVKHPGLLPARSSTPERDREGTPPVSLVLGGVLVQVMPSDHYVLSVDDEPFLTLDSLATGLFVSCNVAGAQSPPIPAPRLAARISQNSVVESGPDVEVAKPDLHTLLIREDGEDLLRVRFSSPRRIDIAGRFYLFGGGRLAPIKGGHEPSAIVFQDGVRWTGAFVPPGAIDLRPQGKGRIDFTRSGMVQVVPEREAR